MVHLTGVMDFQGRKTVPSFLLLLYDIFFVATLV
jgi:hypothetical protein